jgi:hypothetical protein
LPLLVTGDIAISDGKAVTSYSKGALTVEFAPNATAEVHPTGVSVAGKKLVVLTLTGSDNLKYRIHLDR